MLVALFVLPIVKPEGFAGLEGWFDGALNWTGRAAAGNPHSWFVPPPAAGEEGDPRVKDLEEVAIAQREEYFRVLEELRQRDDLRGADPALDRLPLAVNARVLRAHDASATRRSILLDRGSADGIEEGLAVVQGRVLLGVVQHVEEHASRVQLVTDPYVRLRVAVRTQEGVRATAWMRGGSDDDLRLRNLRGAHGLNVRPGDPVVTANFDESLPAGLLVGLVAAAADDDADGFLDVSVRPQMDLDRSTTVLVLLPAP